MTVHWVPKHLVIAWHARLLERFGGPPGLRDLGLLEAALDRPRNVFAYQPSASISRLAAAYAFGLAKNHPFVDGNKRIAFAVMISFLAANGRMLDAAENEATQVILRLAAGTIIEPDLESWLDAHCVPANS